MTDSNYYKNEKHNKRSITKEETKKYIQIQKKKFTVNIFIKLRSTRDRFGNSGTYNSSYFVRTTEPEPDPC